MGHSLVVATFENLLFPKNRLNSIKVLILPSSRHTFYGYADQNRDQSEILSFHSRQSESDIE
jgi:hypothetical protein